MQPLRLILIGGAILFVAPLAAQQAEWQRVTPGGEARCSTGTPYSFFVRRADSTRILLFLEGGGVCWNGTNCHTQPTIVREIGNYDPMRGSGILDLARAENPFARHTIIVAPYCTGDLHLGARDQRYSVPDSTGTAREVQILHRGQTNAMAVLDWIGSKLSSPAQVVVAGTSAGAAPVPFYGDLLARKYPRARVAAIGDGIGIHQLRGAGVPFANWGLPEVLRKHPGWEEFPADWGFTDIVITAARSTARLALYQIDQAWDMSGGAWAVRLGRSASDLPSMLRANQREITEAVPSFRTFTLGGMYHTILSEPQFYSHSSNGVRLRDWVAAIVDGKPVNSVDCRECWRPEIRFDRTHLAIVDSAIRVLSDPAGWDSTDEGRCQTGATSFSLRCAFFVAGGSAPAAAAAYEELFYVSLDRLGLGTVPPNPATPLDPIRQVNDRPGTTPSDMISLLTELRTRISAALDR